MTPCAIVECPSPAREAGYCWSHWAKWKAFGDPLATRRFYRHPDRLRLLAAVSENAATGCWIWTRFLDAEGYGATPTKGRPSRRTARCTANWSHPFLTT